jgi:hypothetical protein
MIIHSRAISNNPTATTVSKTGIRESMINPMLLGKKDKDQMNRTFDGKISNLEGTNLRMRNDYTMTIDEMVNLSLNKTSFGFDFYNPPRSDHLFIPVKGIKYGKQKIPSFIEIATKQKAFMPPPNMYIT